MDPECQMSCEYCIAGEGSDTAEFPAPWADQQIAIPAAGCSVRRRNFQLGCDLKSEGSCGMNPAPSTTGLGCQPCPRSRPGTEGSCPLGAVPTRPSPRQTPLAPWKIGVAVAGSLLGLLLIALFVVLWWRLRIRNKHTRSKLSEPTGSGELSKVPEKLVQAALINSDNVRMCKRPNGED
ncbi:hypothetical protein ABBQ32_000260 [Trebouxia sp. C0010 RCD-2024]